MGTTRSDQVLIRHLRGTTLPETSDGPGTLELDESLTPVRAGYIQPFPSTAEAAGQR